MNELRIPAAVRYALYTLVFVLLYCLGGSLAVYLDAELYTLPLAAAAAGVYEGRDRGALLGGLAGVIAGAFSAVPGAYILAYYALGAASGALGDSLLPRRFASALLPALAFSFALALISPAGAGTAAYRLWKTALYTLAQSPVVFLMLRAIDRPGFRRPSLREAIK